MKNRISLTLIVNAIFFILIAIFIFGQNFLYDTIDKTLKEVEKSHIISLVKDNGNTIANLYHFGFEEELEAVLEEIKTNTPSIETIRILPHKPRQILTNQILTPLVFKNKTIGYLFVQFHYSLPKEFFSRFSTFYTVIFILFLSILFFSSWYLYKRFLSLRTLSKKVEHIDPANAKPLPLLDSYQEIVSITNAINKMLHTLKNYIQLLKKSEQHLKEAQKIAGLSSWEYNPTSKKFLYNEQLLHILGLPTNTNLDWKHFLKMMDSGERRLFLSKIKQELKNGGKFEYTTKLYTPKGECYLKHMVKIDPQRGVIGTSLDITSETLAQQEANYLAYHDPLTGLPNRTSFMQELPAIAKLAKQSDQKFAIIYLDIDNFKFVNDSFGHNTGDELLVQVANDLKKLLKEALLFRIGGDEFVIVLPNIKNKKALQPLLEQIIKIVSKERTIDNKSIMATSSLGIAFYPDDTDDIDTLVRYADLAMYEAKNEGKNTYRFFHKKLKNFLDSLQHTLQDLQEALKQEDQLVLYFQPKIDIFSCKVFGAEALLRWHHPSRGIIYPGEFIPIAEKSDLIMQIDQYVLKKSFKILLEWDKDPHLRHLHLGLNISAKQFKNPFFIDLLQTLLDRYPIDPKKLEIEITETLSMSDISYTIATLQKIKALGFRVALDDFGTGYSSLNYLKKIPFDTLKIDRSFVQDIDKDKDDLEVTKIIVNIAKTFHKDLVAEGVENEEQLKILQSLECQYAQGFYFAKPMVIESFLSFTQKFNNRNSCFQD